MKARALIAIGVVLVAAIVIVVAMRPRGDDQSGIADESSAPPETPLVELTDAAPEPEPANTTIAPEPEAATSPTALPMTGMASIDPFSASPAMLVASSEAPAATDPDTADNSPVRVRFFGRATMPDDTPIEGVAVRAMSYNPENFHDSTSHGETATDSDGRYEITVEVADDFERTIVLMAKGDDGHERVSPSFGPPETLARGRSWRAVGTEHEWNVRIEAPQVLTGRVVNTDDKPVARAIVKAAFYDDSRRLVRRVAPLSVVADDNGAFEMTLATAGSYVLHAGYTEGAMYPHSTAVPIPGTESVEIRIPQRTATFSGKLVTTYPEDSLEGVTVALRLHGQHARDGFFIGGAWPSRSVSTGARVARTRAAGDGTFRFEGLAPAPYELVCEDPEWMLGHGRQGFPIHLSEGQDLSQDYIQITRGRRATGRVVHAGTQDPVPSFPFRVEYDTWTQHRPQDLAADAEGRFEFIAFVMPSAFTSQSPGAIVSRTHGLPSPGSGFRQDMAPGTVLDFVIEVTQSVSVSGFVRRRDGTALAEGSVTFTGFPGTSPRAQSFHVSRTGTFRFETPANVSGEVMFHRANRAAISSGVLRVGTEPIDNVEIIVPDGVTVRGRVLGDDGNPVDEANVNVVFGTLGVSGVSSFQVRTNRDGYFELEQVPPGLLTLSVYKEGYLNQNNQRYTIEPNVPRSDIQIVLQRTGLLEGIVLDNEGKPVPRFMIITQHASGESRHSGSYVHGQPGRFSISFLPAGRVTIAAALLDSSERSESVTVDSPASDITLRIPLSTAEIASRQPGPSEPVPMLPPPPPLTLVGSVVDAETGAPLELFHVTPRTRVERVRRIPDAPGVFEAEIVPIPGASGMQGVVAHLTISAPGFVTRNEAITDPTPQELEDGVMMRRFEMQGGGSVAGRVVDKQTGEPIVGAGVNVSQYQDFPGRLPFFPHESFGANATKTDTEGRFRFTDLAWGVVQLSVRLEPDYAPGSAQTWISRETREQDVGDIALERASQVLIHVFHHPSGDPIAAASVVMRSGMSTILETNREGIVALSSTDSSLQSGYVAMALPNFSLDVVVRNVAPDKVIPIPIGNQSMRVRVLSDTPDMVREYHAALQLASLPGPVSPRHPASKSLPLTQYNLASLATGTPGERSFSHLFPGRWKLAITPQNPAFHRHGSQMAVWQEEFDFTNAMAPLVTIDLSTSRVTGRVVGVDGTPMPDVRVSGRMDASADGRQAESVVASSSRFITPAMTDNLGNFSVEGPLLRGTWKFSALHLTEGSKGSQTVELTGPEHAVEIVLDEPGPGRGIVAIRAESADPTSPLPRYINVRVIPVGGGAPHHFSVMPATHPVHHLDLDVGDYRIESGPGGVPFVRPVGTPTFTIRKGETTEITVAWHLARMLVLRLLDGEGATVSDARVRVFPVEGATASPISEHEVGRGFPTFVDLGDISTGVYRIEATSPTGATGSGLFEVTDTTVTPVTVVLER